MGKGGCPREACGPHGLERKFGTKFRSRLIACLRPVFGYGFPSKHMLVLSLKSRSRSRCCAHPNFNLVEVRNARAYAMRLGSVHLPGEARRTRVKRSRHLPFYDPKVEGR
ncbi:hypothetical protein CRG98_037264 [Punica granatum]|uniref:Uncharacterized protein n=1 Tax=Punica granatum TaxID=22663 RepID=A0A2I0IEB0_PUNGR|nr:hypothetical protein CRG98_037264 [Punica granatum]